MPITDPSTISDFLSRRIDSVIPSKEELEKLLTSGKKLRLYQGFDPSSPNLHIGHLVGLLALKQFQELGHEVIFLIGDFTGMIGDPTGKLQSRTTLTHEQVLANAQTYQDQVKTILNFQSDNPIQIKFNYKWNSKLQFADILKLSSHLTVQQLIERDMYQVRLKENKEIFLNEFLYPLVQGYDSVAMDVDLEVGGTDQMFNMTIGRKLVKAILGKEKFVVTTPLLSDSSGRKIGKTEGNAINLTNPPQEFFGQIMSLPDNAIMPCFKLITLIPSSDLPQLENLTKNDPMQAKKKLAWTLLEMLQGKDAADQGQTHFENTVQHNQLPDDILEVQIAETIALADLVINHHLLPSKSQFRQLIAQNAVKIDNQTISDHKLILSPSDSGKIIQIGKRRFIKIK